MWVQVIQGVGAKNPHYGMYDALLAIESLDISSTASNAMWDEMVRLNSEFGLGEIGSPCPHTPSGSTLEVEPVSWAGFCGTYFTCHGPISLGESFPLGAGVAIPVFSMVVNYASNMAYWATKHAEDGPCESDDRWNFRLKI